MRLKILRAILQQGFSEEIFHGCIRHWVHFCCINHINQFDNGDRFQNQIQNGLMKGINEKKNDFQRMTAQPQLNQKVMNEKQRQEYNLTIVAGLTCVAEIVYYLYVIYVFGINTSVPTRVRNATCVAIWWFCFRFFICSTTSSTTFTAVYLDGYCWYIPGPWERMWPKWSGIPTGKVPKTLLITTCRCPMFGFRRMRIMIPAEQFSSATNMDNKNTSNRRVPTCGTPC